MKIMQWFKKLSLDATDPDVGQLAFFLQMAVDGAKCDGAINESELNALHRFSSKMCGGSPEMSKAILEFIDSPKPPEEFKNRMQQEKWKTPVRGGSPPPDPARKNLL